MAVSLNFERSGAGEPLILLHGIGGELCVWEPVLDPLARRMDVIAVDLPGFGRSPALPEAVAPTPFALADAIAALLDELGVDSAHVAGNSLGGWIALELARRNRARSVTVFSPGGAWRSNVRYATMAVAMDVGLTLIDALGDRVERVALSPRGRRLFGRLACEHPERLNPEEFLADIRALRSTPVLKNLMHALRATPIRPMPSPTCPIRIVWARRDRVVPFRHFGEPLLDRLPTAELVVIDGVGHVPMIDRPRLVAKLILDVTSAVDRGEQLG